MKIFLFIIPLILISNSYKINPIFQRNTINTTIPQNIIGTGCNYININIKGEILYDPIQGEYASCSFECFLNSKPKYQCIISETGCILQNKFDRYNFFSLLYCYFDGNLYVFIPLSIILLLLIFRFLSAIVDDFLCFAITNIAQHFKLSDQMAGVTLIAFANGAGDVITAFVAAGTVGGISYNIGSLYGAALFVCSTVIAFTILQNKSGIPIMVTPRILYRDIGFFIFGTLIIIFFGLSQKIYWWSNIDKIDNKNKIIEAQEESQEAILDISYELSVSSFKNSFKKVQRTSNKIQQELFIGQFLKESFNSRSAKKRVVKQKQIEKVYSHKGSDKQLLKHYQRSHSAKPTIELEGIQQRIKEPEKYDPIDQEIAEEVSVSMEIDDILWNDKTNLQKLDFSVNYPFELIRKLTIPPCNIDNYQKNLCTTSPIFGLFLILWTFNIMEYWQAYAIGVPFASALCFFFYKSQQQLHEGQLPFYFIWICFIATFQCVMWTYVISDILIDLLNLYVVIFKLSNSFIGITILGICTSLPDALTTIALSKKGFAQMGLSGLYAGQSFGLLVGFAVAQLRNTLINGPQEFALFADIEKNILDIIVITAILINLFATIIFAIVNKMKLTQQLAIFLLTLYVIFLAVVTGIQIWIILDNIQQ